MADHIPHSPRTLRLRTIKEEGSLWQGKRVLFLAGLVLIGLNIYWDNFYLRYGITLYHGSLFAQYWILHLAFAGYLLSLGTITYFILSFKNYEIATYFMPCKVFQCILQIVVGFCLPVFVLPLWLTVRRGTIECFIGRDCKNLFGLLYLAVIDVMCDTMPSLGKFEPSTLPTCEGVSYMIPIMIFTMIPIISAFYLYKTYFMTKLNNRSFATSEGPFQSQVLERRDVSSKSKHRTSRIIKALEKIVPEDSDTDSDSFTMIESSNRAHIGPLSPTSIDPID